MNKIAREYSSSRISRWAQACPPNGWGKVPGPWALVPGPFCPINKPVPAVQAMALICQQENQMCH